MPPSPQAIVFLGNPGKDYLKTRHNLALQLCERWPALANATWQSKFKGLWTSLPWNGRKIYLLMPQTFMNLSGESAQAMSAFLKLAPESWVAVHDDLELALGEVRWQFGGGLGGHNGLKSLRQHWGTDQFYRLRLGIGRPQHGDVANYVLSRFSSDEEISLEQMFPRALNRLETGLNA